MTAEEELELESAKYDAVKDLIAILAARQAEGVTAAHDGSTQLVVQMAGMSGL